MKNTIKTLILFLAFFIGVGSYTLSAQNPPAHAKAHGVKKKYRYYPEANVYFDPVGKRYSFLSGGLWISANNLPSTMRLKGNYNDFDFDGDKPWKENSKHKEKFKATKPYKSNDVKKIQKTFHSNSKKANGRNNNKK